MRYTVRRVRPEAIEAALGLAGEVFLAFETPVYPSKGVENFRQNVIENEEFVANCKRGICPIYGAFVENTIVGLIAMRENKTLIMLLFVKQEYQRLDVATALFRCLLSDCLRETPTLAEVTVNSSPYGKPFYMNVGFVAPDGEQLTDGMLYTPMKYTVRPQDRQENGGNTHGL